MHNYLKFYPYNNQNYSIYVIMVSFMEFVKSICVEFKKHI